MMQAKAGNDTYGCPEGRELSLPNLLEIMRGMGVGSVYVKRLSPNDNSKNQIYLGGDFSALNIIPVREFEEFVPKSEKPGLKKSDKLIRGIVDFRWLDCHGAIHPAPDAKLILYPQYPEVRLSGFLRNSSVSASEWMDVSKSGRNPDRFLIIGVHPARYCFAYLAVPGSRVAAELKIKAKNKKESVLQEIGFNIEDSKSLLISELRRVHINSPIPGKKLNRSSKVAVPYKARNGAGYTLEAELGIAANGVSEPDFHGWEVKTHSGPIVTLMTPEPSGGFYVEKGVGAFVRAYGYKDKSGIQDRLNFGGLYKHGVRHHETKLMLVCSGYESGSKINLSGGIKLLDEEDGIAAEWSFKKLLEHWNRKHAKAVYVPYEPLVIDGFVNYSYEGWADFGEGTDFLKFIDALVSSKIYYDPAIKIESESSSSPKIKRRSQFRINYKHIAGLYGSWGRQYLID